MVGTGACEYLCLNAGLQCQGFGVGSSLIGGNKPPVFINGQEGLVGGLRVNPVPNDDGVKIDEQKQ